MSTDNSSHVQANLSTAQAATMCVLAGDWPEAAQQQLTGAFVWGFELTGGNLEAAAQTAAQFGGLTATNEAVGSSFRFIGVDQ
jgi:hypothetical protein